MELKPLTVSLHPTQGMKEHGLSPDQFLDCFQKLTASASHISPSPKADPVAKSWEIACAFPFGGEDRDPSEKGLCFFCLYGGVKKLSVHPLSVPPKNPRFLNMPGKG